MALTICNDSRENEFYGKVGTNYAHIHILIAFWKSRGHLNKGSTHLLEIVFESRVRYQISIHSIFECQNNNKKHWQ